MVNRAHAESLAYIHLLPSDAGAQPRSRSMMCLRIGSHPCSNKFLMDLYRTQVSIYYSNVGNVARYSSSWWCDVHA